MKMSRNLKIKIAAIVAAVLSAVGFIGIIVISFYMQTLFALSSQSLAMTERVEQIAQTIKTSQDRASDLEDQSYGFRKLLQGVESYVQPAGPDEVSGELRQYIGVVTHDADGVIDGFVQLGIRPTRLETLLEPVQIDHVLDGVHVGADGALMAERVPLTVATAGIALVCLAVIFCLTVVEPKPGAPAARRCATHVGAQPLDEKRPRQTQPAGGVALSARRMRARDLRSGCRDGCR